MGHHSASRRAVVCRLVTISDTRTVETDHAGALLRVLLAAQGHRIAGQQIVPDTVESIRAAVQTGIDDPACEVVITTGGTGVAPRDVTPEAVEPLLDKHLPGFGELFRQLSFAEVGAVAWFSRALAGCAADTAVFCLPGSFKAVKLAVEQLLLPRLPHLVELLRQER